MEQASQAGHAYLYYCGLCDEALCLLEKEVSARKLILHFENCPGCGFPLQQTLAPEPKIVPLHIASSLMIARLSSNSYSKTHKAIFERPTIETRSNITGIALDSRTQLRPGKFTVLQGEIALDLSFSLLVKATAPSPIGFDSLAAWLDGGNSYDAYRISELAIQQRVNPYIVHERVMISRAFTFHQLNKLITEKLPPFSDKHYPELVIVSDLTALFCDPDVRNIREALDTFKTSIKSLVYQAEQRHAIIIATIPHSRNRPMEEALVQTAHSTIRLGYNFDINPRPRKRKQIRIPVGDKRLTQFIQ